MAGSRVPKQILKGNLMEMNNYKKEVISSLKVPRSSGRFAGGQLLNSHVGPIERDIETVYNVLHNLSLLSVAGVDRLEASKIILSVGDEPFVR